jgi:hypothetical protein
MWRMVLAGLALYLPLVFVERLPLCSPQIKKKDYRAEESQSAHPGQDVKEADLCFAQVWNLKTDPTKHLRPVA